LQSNGGTLLDLMLTAQDFSDFLKAFEYLQIIEEQMLGSITKLNSSLSLLEETKSELATEKEEAILAQKEAETALEEAKAAREAAQEAARIAAEEEAAAREAEEAAAEAQDSSSDDSSSSSGENISTTPNDDGADWSSDKETFVSSWGVRLDAYLSGSPLSGYGETFAAAAWDYGIDPRFSAAISTVESTKGTYCFRSYNAWGWGSVSWSSWEEAIYAHAKGLARGYGYTVSESGAKKYCPGNWQNWYNKVSSEMNKI
jgi:peptidoglycan DL-endopeptidase CwlO